ncbi:hypothetical protein ACFSBZ_10890 [Amnibacterium flavum]|uniref:Potassium transporter Trk n=1 Tax=Amnibacterium flavum TaxID=2173173 RepID=A0A2V1HS07_9MICO|nr:hypothetical protein [Amnibacterium flavum]PVZ95338.1 hypothetical protein DDQ50_02115 [Amnibacterium flavum]
MTDEPQAPRDETERVTARVRRSPRIFNFVLAGVIVGAIVALILTFAFPADGEFGPLQIFGFLLLIAAVVFGAAGAVVALIVDRASRRNAREVEVVRQRENGDDDEAGSQL